MGHCDGDPAFEVNQRQEVVNHWKKKLLFDGLCVVSITMTSTGPMKLVKKVKALQQKSLRWFHFVPVPWATLHFLSKDGVIILDLIKV